MSRGVSTGVPGATKSEMVLWQRRYLDCCAELNQWDVVGEYAKVHLEYCFKVGRMGV